MLICRAVVFLLFKEKTAYEMRISDWSSDVCSSDLVRVAQDDRIVARIFDDEPKPLIPLFKFAQQTLEFVLAFAGADGGTDGTGQGDCLNRAFAQRHIAERCDKPGAPISNALLGAPAGENNDRDIRSCRLILYPDSPTSENPAEQPSCPPHDLQPVGHT